MSEVQQAPAPAPAGPITLDQFAEELTREQEEAAKAPQAEAETDAPTEPTEAAADDEEPAVEDAGDEADEVEAEAEEESEPEPIPDPPQSWSKEDREAWADLTPKAREVVLRREKDRDTAVAKFAQQTTEAVKAVQAIAQRTQEIETLATDAFEAKWQEKTKGPISWSNWLAQAQSQDEFQQIMLQKAQYDAEKADLERAKKYAEEQSELSYRAFIAEQSQELPKVAPELADPEKGAERRAKVFKHLEERGFPPEVLKHVSAIELAVAYDAMRFREMDAKAKTQAAAPRKTQPTPPAKPVKPTGTGSVSPQRNLQALSQKLTKTGTLDAFVELMNAEEDLRARKQGKRQ